MCVLCVCLDRVSGAPIDAAAAPRQYASKLVGLLIGAGAQPTWVPGVSISRLTEQQLLQKVRWEHLSGSWCAGAQW